MWEAGGILGKFAQVFAQTTPRLIRVPHPIRPSGTFPSTLEKALTTAPDFYTRYQKVLSEKPYLCYLHRHSARDPGD